MDDSSNTKSLQLKAEGLQVSDPQNILNNYPIFFAFPKSRSENFPIALGLAKAATINGEQLVEGRTLYWAGFTLSASDLDVATELLRIAGGWVGTFVRINGQKVSQHFNAYLTLSCYQEASQCSNHAAHCHKIIDDPFQKCSQTPETHWSQFLDNKNSIETIEEIKEFVFPCKRMLELSMHHPQFSFKRMHQVSHQEQIQASAVQYGISICPFFDANAFKEIGVRTRTIRISLPKSKS